MAIHIIKEIDLLKKQMLTLSSLVEESVRKSVKSVIEIDTKLAQEVIDGDARINALEIELEEECLKTLALHSPVANDLRFIITILKLNNGLERIGDLSVNVAERVPLLKSHAIEHVPEIFSNMGEKALEMLNMSIDALVNLDPRLAAKVREADDEVDDMNREVYDWVKSQILDTPEKVRSHLNFISIAKHMERMADHSVEIAEDIIYMIDGHIVRHQG